MEIIVNSTNTIVFACLERFWGTDISKHYKSGYTSNNLYI